MGSPTQSALVLVTVVTSITLLSFVPSSLGTKQTVTFFENRECVGRSVTYDYWKEEGLNNTWVGSNATAVRVVGLWSFTLTSMTANQTYLGVGQPPVPSGACIRKETMVANANAFVFTAIKRVGPSEMNDTGSTIYLSEGNDFTGQYISVYHADFGKGNMTMENPMIIKSWAIFGPRSAVTYTDDSAAPNCLKKTHGTDGFTMNPRTSIVVKVFTDVIECGGGEGTTSTTPRPGSSTKQPGSASSAIASLTLVTLISSAIFVLN